MFSIWLAKRLIVSARELEQWTDGWTSAPLNGPGRSRAEQEVRVAVGDLGRGQPPARAVPLRRVVDHAEQRGERQPRVRGGPGAGPVERVLGDPLERLAARADAAPGGAALDHVALLLEDEHVVAVPDDVLDPQAHERAQLLGGLAWFGEQRLGLHEQRVHQLVAD